MDLFRNGTDKTGTGQVPFTRQILSEPFVFLSEPFQFFRSSKRPLSVPMNSQTNWFRLVFQREKPFYFLTSVVRVIYCYKTGSLSNIWAVLAKIQQNLCDSAPLMFVNTSRSDWSMETMVPWQSWQKGQEMTSGTNRIACRQLATDHLGQGTFVTQCALRTFNVSMAHLPGIFRNFRSELTWKKIFLANVIRLQLSRNCAGRIGIHPYFDSMDELRH